MPEPTFTAIATTDIEIDDPFTGAKASPDDTSLAEKYRNRDNALKAQPIDLRLAEAFNTTGSFVTVSSLVFRVPNYSVGLRVKGSVKVSGGATMEVKAVVGAATATATGITSATYVAFDVTIADISASKNTDATFALQTRISSGAGNAYAKIDTLECRFVAIAE